MTSAVYNTPTVPSNMSSPHDLEKGSYHHHELSRPPIQLTPEQYEQLFLQPGGKSPAGNLASRFGNPTPLGIVSFLVALTPTACFLMGWGGAEPTSLPVLVGAYYFVGGLGCFVCGVMEWVLGNSFPSVVFMTFGGYWLALGAIEDPMHAITSAFNGGSNSVTYNKGLMFYWAFWGVVCFVFFLASLRTNVAFVFLFFTLVLAFSFLSAGYARLGDANLSLALAMIKGAGACFWATICSGWYILVSLLFSIVEMPFGLPLGDLSGFLAPRKQIVH